MLGAHLVAFHTRTYAANFVESCERLLGARVSLVSQCSNMFVEHEGRRVTVRAFPIGVAYDWFESMARDAPPTLNNFIGHQRVLLGVDRLDYTKGILQRFPTGFRWSDERAFVS